MFRMRLFIFVSLAFVMVQSAMAQQLDGRTVLMVFSRGGDEQVAIQESIDELRQLLELSRREMPTVFVQVNTRQGEAYAKRLGFKPEDAPVAAVVEWGNPARFGPKRVINGAIQRMGSTGLNAQALISVVEEWLKAEGYGDRYRLVRDARRETAGEETLRIDALGAQSSGRPLYTVSVRARLHNYGGLVASGAHIRIQYRAKGSSRWMDLGSRYLGRIQAGHVSVEDIFADARKLPGLLDSRGNALPFELRAVLKHDGRQDVAKTTFDPRATGYR